ncbi:DUF4214 domain-containing protein [Massilia timonae]|uniref:DUF4214 domain-containing protein n=1 Tax=Massilia timonae CCUG 45783 TaxID=883126 RepID=K9E1A4_9BURK|nr:DUF4214 domain-containing protein [Massilia timonae]EKU83215.1 hypothetical protein HMPREF9710_01613 [Massilia timonae CCUG 45783]
MAIVATHVAAVQELYVAYFGRPADPAGLDYWTNIVEAQKSTAAVSATFAESDEYQDAFEGMTNTQIVNKIYMNMFGREAEATGRDYWVKLLDAGTISVDNIVADVAKAAVGTDGEAVENKVAAATAFTAALDTEAEVAGYAGPDALALAKAFITSVTTDATLATQTAPAALNATVAAVVAAGTEFTLESAVANLTAANAAKSAVLADLAEDEAVAAQLEKNGVTETPTDAQVLKAIADIDTAGDNGINGFITGFSGLNAAQQSARIASLQADNAAELRAATVTATTGLNARTAAVNAVENLGAAYADYQAAIEAEEAAETAAALASTAASAALQNFGTLAKGTVAAVPAVGEPTSYTFTPAAGGAAVTVITINADGEAVLAANTVTEARYPGVTAALTAINASLVADASYDDAVEALEIATIAADILDAADDGSNLAAVGATFQFVQLGDDELPTYQQILAEDEFFTNQLAAQDALVGGGEGSYTTAINQLATDVDAVMTGPTPTAAALKVVLDEAVADRVITAAQATSISGKFAATTAGTEAVNKAVADINWAAKYEAFTDARDALLAAETGPTGDTDIGALVNALIDQQDTVDGINEKIENFADAVAAYNAAQELNGAVTAANTAITNATKVITDAGYAAPVFLSQSVTLATAKDDLFLANKTDLQVRNFGAQGDDVLYVGSGLTYNDTEIGTGTGQSSLRAAGDNSVLEFFLQQSGNNVIVHIENKAFGSDSGAAADITKITLVGVDLEDLVIDNGFISI